MVGVMPGRLGAPPRRGMPAPPNARAAEPSDIVITGGYGGTVARLEDLDRCAAALGSAARSLEAAWWILTRMQRQLDERSRPLLAQTPESAAAAARASEARVAVEPLRSGRLGTLAIAGELRDTARRVTRARAEYTRVEGFVARYVRGLWRGAVTGLGLAPGGPLLMGPAIGVLLRAEALLVLRGGPIPGDRAQEYVGALANAVRAMLPGPQLPSADPVPQVSGLFALGVRAVVGPKDVAALPVVGTRRTGPPPRGVQGLVSGFRGVGTRGAGGSDRGDGVVVTKVRRADGTLAWSVSIPGTQRAGLGTEKHPFDNLSNLELEAGMAADSTRAVLAAMRAAGVGADEPVVLAGHSQGGLVAQRIAASGAYAVAAVLTLGSPTGTRTMRSKVPTLHLEHTTDLIPTLDARHNTDDPLTTTVRRKPKDAKALSPVDAHATASYEELAGLVDESADESVLAWREAMDGALGTDGEATSRVYAVQRLDTAR